ncbi:MAG: DUF2124 domain-containing protein [Methanothrix sp.]|jgi:hypothetical protein|nr:DUF2124 domain-containing protein [Methanothrix sp.]OPY56063.1 MAG: hypothetical protein A4E51_00581 [Methanosaeta sp. PtaU1.Bin055]HOI68813.1 DUF2124 domain-containing protein [Methanothrix sp.]HPY73356.1 DUF2124 domain-containing protein [Methanothrix sp.]HQA62976.1 DUF2124 domain-containing protein [Methanothrix sp.]
MVVRRDLVKKINDIKGLGGMLNGFRELVKDDESITFVGTPGFCTPFATFLGFPVREKRLAFVPGLDVEKTRSLVATEHGMELGGAASPDADVVVILGGMAMPKIGVSIEEMAALLGKIQHKKLIGVCFMGILEQAGWCGTPALGFDYVMNTNLSGDISGA